MPEREPPPITAPDAHFPQLGVPDRQAAAWITRHRARLAEAVARCDDVRALWRISGLIGYKDGSGQLPDR